MMEIVFAGPQQLHRLTTDLLGDRRRFHHVVVRETPAKAPARAQQMDGDVAFFHAERVGDERAPLRGSLGRRPDFELPVPELCRAILRLERRVRDERKRVGAFDDLHRAVAERSFGVAV
jgi:hypothetical protein